MPLSVQRDRGHERDTGRTRREVDAPWMRGGRKPSARPSEQAAAASMPGGGGALRSFIASCQGTLRYRVSGNWVASNRRAGSVMSAAPCAAFAWTCFRSPPTSRVKCSSSADSTMLSSSGVRIPAFTPSIPGVFAPWFPAEAWPASPLLHHVGAGTAIRRRVSWRCGILRSTVDASIPPPHRLRGGGNRYRTVPVFAVLRLAR